MWVVVSRASVLCGRDSEYLWEVGIQRECLMEWERGLQWSPIHYIDELLYPSHPFAHISGSNAIPDSASFSMLNSFRMLNDTQGRIKGETLARVGDTYARQTT